MDGEAIFFTGRGGASIPVENTWKGNCLIFILAPQSRLALPAVGRHWPSDHDDEDWRVVTVDMIEALFLVEERESDLSCPVATILITYTAYILCKLTQVCNHPVQLSQSQFIKFSFGLESVSDFIKCYINKIYVTYIHICKIWRYECEWVWSELREICHGSESVRNRFPLLGGSHLDKTSLGWQYQQSVAIVQIWTEMNEFSLSTDLFLF